MAYCYNNISSTCMYFVVFTTLSLTYLCIVFSISVNQPLEDGREAQARHYKTLQDMWKKPRPNQKDVSQLLELEFEARRAFVDSLDNLNEEDKPAKVLEAYPCFKELRHVSGVKC